VGLASLSGARIPHSRGAAPTIANQRADNNAFSTAIPVPLVAGITPGNLILLFVSQQGLVTLNPSAGYVSVGSAVNGIGGWLSVFAKIATGSDACVLTNVGGVWCTSACLEIANFSSLANLYSGFSTYPAGGFSPDPPLVNPGLGVRSYLALVAIATLASVGGAAETVTSFPAGYGAPVQPSVANGGGTTLGVASRTIIASSEDPGVAVNSNPTLGGIAATILLRR
jgi:hypothetical protein